MRFKRKSTIRDVVLLGSLRKIHRAHLRRVADQKFAVGKPAAALLRLSKLAELGDPVAFYRIGACHDRGLGVPQNFAVAVRWYEAAAEKGVVEAMERLGDIYFYDGVPQPAVSSSTSVHSRQPPPPQNTSISAGRAKAAYWNNLAAGAGSAEAQAKLAYQYISGAGVAANAAEAQKWFSAAAEQGSAAGQFGLGTLFASGALGTKDEETAARWFEKSAAQGNHQASFALAMILYSGENVPTDYPRAAELFLDAAAAGNTLAIFYLGEIYRLGREGVPQDLVAAETWLRRACSRGHIPAHMALVYLLSERPSPHDHDAAAMILRQGAELGDPRCQLTLGEFYASGQRGRADPDEAIAWLRRAGRLGYVSARILCGRSPFGYTANGGSLEKAPMSIADYARMASPVNATEPWYGWE